MHALAPSGVAIGSLLTAAVRDGDENATVQAANTLELLAHNGTAASLLIRKHAVDSFFFSVR